jgi:hypothetical protein
MLTVSRYYHIGFFMSQLSCQFATLRSQKLPHRKHTSTEIVMFFEVGGIPQVLIVYSDYVSLFFVKTELQSKFVLKVGSIQAQSWL